jgi:diketogulonate reductase-like aldo/keto reductase
LIGVPSIRLSSGSAIPVLGLGTWALWGQTAYDAVLLALEAGYRHVDTATMYRNEVQVGRAVRDSGVGRENVFITTKMPPGNAGRERQTIETSLRALDTEYVDLWLVHWPPRGRAQPPSWEQFLEIADRGLAKAVGVSNYSTSQLDELIGATGVAPAVNQIEWGPSLYDARVVAGHRSREVVLEGYSPFKTTNLRHPTLTRIAEDHGVTPAQVVLRWHVEHEVVAIPKSQRPERIRQNFDIFDFSLSAEEVSRIDALSGRRS